MKQKLIPLLPFGENFVKGFPETFPKHTKTTRQFNINCKKATRQSQRNISKIPIKQNQQETKNKKLLQSDRPQRIKFIKEIQKDIKIFENRNKVTSLMKSTSSKETTITNKQNECLLESFKSLKKQDIKIVHFIPSLVSQQSSKNQKTTPQRYPQCKVGKVRYRTSIKAPIRNPRSFWQKVSLSEIQIKQNSDEELVTLKELQCQLNQN